MVSLMRRTNLSAGGAVYFNDAIVSRENEGTEPLERMVGAGESFRVLHTVVPVSLYAFFVFVIQIAVIVGTCNLPQLRHQCEPFLIMLQVQTALWCVSWMLHQHLKWKHKMLRINGYLEFYKQTDLHVQAQFYIVSLWSTILLAVSGIYHYTYMNDALTYNELEQRCQNATNALSPNNVVAGLMTLEIWIILFVMAIYLAKVVKFNMMHPPPDVQREDWMMSFVRESFSAGDVGYRESNEHMHDLLEKQADLIRHLQEHNAMLNHKIIQLGTRSHVEPECT